MSPDTMPGVNKAGAEYDRVNAAPPPPADDDLELLLPFYATGRLPDHDMRRVAARLAADAEFRRRLELVLEEQAQAESVNAIIPPPSSDARNRLFALIDAEPARAGALTPGRAGVRRWLARLADAVTPRASGYAIAGLVALAIVQAGALVHLATTNNAAPAGPGAYVTASAPERAQANSGQALVRFAAGVTMADAAAWLEANRMLVVDGPRPGGFWRLRTSSQSGDAAAAQGEALARLRANPALFDAVLPE